MKYHWISPCHHCFAWRIWQSLTAIPIDFSLLDWQCLIISIGWELQHSDNQFLLQILQTWDVVVYQIMWKELEMALLKGVQDAIGETRVLSRQAIVIYLRKLPARYDYVTRGLPTAVRQKVELEIGATEISKPPLGNSILLDFALKIWCEVKQHLVLRITVQRPDNPQTTTFGLIVSMISLCFVCCTLTSLCHWHDMQVLCF